jgi:hypothetical protein
MAQASTELLALKARLADLDSDIELAKMERKVVFIKLVRTAAKEPAAAAELGIPTVMPVSNRGRKAATPAAPGEPETPATDAGEEEDEEEENS